MIHGEFDSSATSGGVPNILFFDESPALMAQDVAAAHEAVRDGQQPPEPQEIGSVALSSPERHALERTLWVLDFAQVPSTDEQLRLATAPGRFALEWLIRQDLDASRSDIGPVKIHIETFAGYHRGQQSTGNTERGAHTDNTQPVSYTLTHRLRGFPQPPTPALRHAANGFTGVEHTGPVIVHHALVLPAVPGSEATSM